MGFDSLSLTVETKDARFTRCSRSGVCACQFSSQWHDGCAVAAVSKAGENNVLETPVTACTIEPTGRATVRLLARTPETSGTRRKADFICKVSVVAEARVLKTYSWENLGIMGKPGVQAGV